MIAKRLCLIALGLLMVSVAWTPAASACGFDGTVPGTSARTYAFDVGGQTIYVDDRDYIDADDQNGYSGGLWIYLESNGIPGLQRGGRHAVLGQFSAPFVWLVVSWEGAQAPPQTVTVGGLTVTWDGTVVPPVGRTVAAGGQNLSDATFETDPCWDGTTPDTILL